VINQGKQKGVDEDQGDFEVQLILAWPGPNDPPPRSVRLPGLRVTAWPQPDGSVLYEVKYRSAPYEQTSTRRKKHDTVQMNVLLPNIPGKK